jgi:two-component system LytT family response regulator
MEEIISSASENEFPEIHNAYQASSVEEAYIYLSKNAPDILFSGYSAERRYCI